jgi:short-subunit dehydrogenase
MPRLTPARGSATVRTMANNDKSRPTALITGASAGIGVALAECFARDGYDLILSARTESALREVGDRLAQSYGVRVTAFALDLGEIGAGTKLAQAIEKQGLHVDVLVNNAGYGYAGAFVDSTLEVELGMVDLNVRTLLELSHIYWPSILKNPRGGVLNVASTAAFQPGPLMATYFATKAFVLSLTEALWEEARETGVCPGPTESKFRERAGMDKKKLARASASMSSAEVAELGYRAWKANKRVEITGLRNRVVARAVSFLPRRAVLGAVRTLQSPL